MDKVTLLSKEQVWGRKRLEIFKKRGTKAAITDFSNILCGKVCKETIDDTDYTKNLEKRTGVYYTRTRASNKNYRTVSSWVYAISKNGNKREIFQTTRDLSIRPVIDISSEEKIPTNGKEPQRAEDGVLEVEYGYYPQMAVSNMEQKLLEQLYKEGLIETTGNKYTTLGRWNKESRQYDIVQNNEYLYQGRRYVRVKVNDYGYKLEEASKLSNGKVYSDDDNTWIEVEPVKWLVDEKARIMTTDKLILSGIPFELERENTKNPEGRFDRTSIKEFMDEYLAKEMFQVRKLGEQSKEKNTNPYILEFDDVSEEDIIREAIKANVSVFLHGKPGCGKSDRVKQLDPDFIELNLSHLDPELLDGLAGEKDGKAVHIKPPHHQ